MKVAILDFGTGNLHSLAKGLDAAGADVGIDSDPAAALAADALVLPGVGAFGAACERIAPAVDALRGALLGGKPCLGVCLGMQLLYERSEEGPGQGLGIFSGSVRRLAADLLPQMGWNDVIPVMADPLFAGLGEPVVYYANSYVADADDGSGMIAHTTYAGVRFPAAVRRGSVWGVQFHPEKSGAAGRALLRNWLRAARAA
ncbi:MAG: imidazole glycerol phosphate synthase subunit HisH [Longimicrobiaceae bacterium]